jgi:hypothetical protein
LTALERKSSVFLYQGGYNGLRWGGQELHRELFGEEISLKAVTWNLNKK